VNGGRGRTGRLSRRESRNQTRRVTSCDQSTNRKAHTSDTTAQLPFEFPARLPAHWHPLCFPAPPPSIPPPLPANSAHPLRNRKIPTLSCDTTVVPRAGRPWPAPLFRVHVLFHARSSRNISVLPYSRSLIYGIAVLYLVNGIQRRFAVVRGILFNFARAPDFRRPYEIINAARASDALGPAQQGP
jgi:hypothetical protein